MRVFEENLRALWVIPRFEKHALAPHPSRSFCAFAAAALALTSFHFPLKCPLFLSDNPRWVAPEALRGEKISRKVDVYSFAIIMWEVQTRGFPFEDVEAQYAFSYQFANAISLEHVSFFPPQMCSACAVV